MGTVVNLFGKFRSRWAKYRAQRMRELHHCQFNASPVEWFTGPETIIYLDENGKPERTIVVH